MANILEARHLKKSYAPGAGVFAANGRGSRAVAVNGVSFSVAAGETFASSERAVAARPRSPECFYG
jgi:ABC-type glutathione transport system ATPase component